MGGKFFHTIQTTTYLGYQLTHLLLELGHFSLLAELLHLQENRQHEFWERNVMRVGSQVIQQQIKNIFDKSILRTQQHV